MKVSWKDRNEQNDAQIEDCFVWTISGPLRAVQLDQISRTMEECLEELRRLLVVDPKTLKPCEIKISLKSDQAAISVSTTQSPHPMEASSSAIEITNNDLSLTQQETSGHQFNT